MNYALDQIPFFQQLESSHNILLAGMGGGFDVYCGIPLYLHLKAQGKKVVLGNLSFTQLPSTTATVETADCYKIGFSDRELSGRGYFPELYLKKWLGLQGDNADVYAFRKVGPKPLRDVYRHLIKKYDIDTVVLVDGGTDCLMFGDESGLGTPHEDISSMVAAYRSGVKHQYLVSIGFGVDHYHGVSHYRFLENVAEIMKAGGYLGMFHMMREMESVQKYIEAVDYANAHHPGMESIVSNSVVSSLEGEYGNYHRTKRTAAGELWINPLMGIGWCFDLREAVRRIKYYDYVKDAKSMSEFNGKLSQYRHSLKEYRGAKGMKA